MTKRLLAVATALVAAAIFAVFASPAAADLAGGQFIVPGGRLTLSTALPGNPIMVSDVAAATTFYYTPYQGAPQPGQVPVYQGGWQYAQVNAPIPLAMATGTIAANSEYDVFLVSSGNVVSTCTGPVWTNGTTRATAISIANGIWVNTTSMTCTGGAAGTTAFTVGALQGTYVGTIASLSAGQVTWNIKPAAASHGSANMLGVYNAYNRIHVTSIEQTSTASNTYATNTWHPWDGTGQNLNTVTYIDGLGQSAVRASIQSNVTPTNSDHCQIGINLNSTSATPTILSTATAPATAFNLYFGAAGVLSPTLGLNVAQAMENSLDAATCTENTTAALFNLSVDLDD